MSQPATVSSVLTVEEEEEEESKTISEKNQHESEMKSEEAPTSFQTKMLDEEFESNLLETVETIQNEMDSLVKIQLTQSVQKVEIEEEEKKELNQFEQDKLREETATVSQENQSKMNADFNSAGTDIDQHQTDSTYETKNQSQVQGDVQSSAQSEEINLLSHENKTAVVT
jgi:hypothetical protein